MSLIRVLSDEVSNKIAAGEVVARPASVVKELVENSLDAGASRIVVKIERAGAKLISVADDGRGMDADDALLCLEAHATSKIKDSEDIGRISSFGFRGEALPSIASVSRLVLRTRRPDDREGVETRMDGGRALDSLPVGCAPGTEVVARDLFFNTPARRKFLKADATEEKHVHDTFVSMALAHPSIAFELYADGRVVFSSPAANSLEPRISAFFGKRYLEGMTVLKFRGEGVEARGYIARHGFFKASRREQRVYVNGRPVEALAVYSGIRDGYGSLVPKGRFPPVLLFLRMPPEGVDVNVHPAKREVRFRSERQVTTVVADAIRAALKGCAIPSVSIGGELGGMSPEAIIQAAEISYTPETLAPEHDDFTVSPRDTLNLAPGAGFDGGAGGELYGGARTSGTMGTMAPPPGRTDFGLDTPVPGNPVPASTPMSPHAPPTPSFGAERRPELPGCGPLAILGTLADTYIVAAANTGLILIDQHAAHERILYERLLRNSRGDNPSQRLLIPITVELGRSEVALLEKYSGLFVDIGFEIEEFGGNTVAVGAVPAALGEADIRAVLMNILAELLDEDGGGKGGLQLAALAKAACKSAVKANDRLAAVEIDALVEQMAACELPFSCPHGRPTILNISIAELRRRFGR